MKLYNSAQQNFYKTNVLSPNRAWSAEVKIADSATIPTGLRSFKISECMSDGKNITMGNVITKQLDVELINIPKLAKVYFYEGAQVNIFLYLHDELNSSNKCEIVTSDFYIDKVAFKKASNGSYSISITAYDKTFQMSKPFLYSGTDYNMSNILSYLGAKYELGFGSLDFDPTLSPLEEEITDKEMLGYIAGLMGKCAHIDDDNKISFKWYSAYSTKVESKHIYEGSNTIEESRTIKMLESGTQNNIIVYPSNALGYSINFENPYMTEVYLQDIYNDKISGDAVTYTVGKLKHRGDPLMNAGSIVTVVDRDGTTRPFWVMNRVIEYDGGLFTTLECQGESETTISFRSNSPTDRKINRVLSKMEEAIKNATDVITQTKGSTFELIPKDESDPTKGNSGWKLYSEINQNVILANSGGIGFSSNGGESFNAAAIYIDENGLGHINANYIDVGELDGSLIKANTISVSKDNVVGLNSELEDLLEVANTANSNASSALTTANMANSNASSAYSVASTANGKIASWCHENDTTLIDGSKIFTGSITANQIEAGAITADKLDVGITKQINKFANPNFDIEIDGEIVFWNVRNGTISPQDEWFAMRPDSISKAVSFYQSVWLKPGRYAVVARLNIYNANATNENSSLIFQRGDKTYWHNYMLDVGTEWYKGKNQDFVVKCVFDHTDSEGYVKIGLGTLGIGFPSKGYIACVWASLYDAPNESVGTYCSVPDVLADGYKESNLLTYKDNLNDWLDYRESFSVDNSGSLDVLGGRIGAFDFSREGFSLTSHVPLIQGDGILATVDAVLEIGMPDISKVGTIDNMDMVAWGKVTSPYIYISSTDNTQISFMDMYGYYCEGSDGKYSEITPSRIKAFEFTDLSKEKYKENIQEKGSVIDKLKNSKIYEYNYKAEKKNEKKKLGFIVEREAPEDVVSSDGEGINLYSMASMNWKATQEIIERLEAVERAVKK